MVQIEARPTVLVVEKNPRALSSITTLLQDDFSVLSAICAEDALTVLDQQQVVVILADQTRPGTTGHAGMTSQEFLAKAKDLSRAPRILVSGYADVDVLVNAINHGHIYTFISKPWEPIQLRAAVKESAEHCLWINQLERERGLLNALMDHAPDAIWFKDAASRLTHVNQAAAALLGVKDPAEAVGKTMFEFLPAHQARDIHAQERDLIRNNRADRNLTQELHLKGVGTRWVETTRGPVRERGSGVDAIVGVSREVTAQKHAEAALRESEAKYRAIVETASEGIWILDELLQTIFVNRKMAAMLGATAEEVQGKSVSEFMREEDIATQLPAFGCNPRRDLDDRAADVRLRKSDGTVAWAIVSCSPMPDAPGEAYRTLAVLTDITSRKSVEDQIRQAQKLEAVSCFAGGVAHDFNNILTAIGGHSQLLLRRMEPGGPFRGPVEKIAAAADQGANLTRQLLSFAQRRAVESEVLDLNAAISNFENLCYPLLGGAIEVVTKLDDHLGRIRVDAGQLDQVLMNLVVHARDAMPDGGRLTIETDQVERTALAGHPAGAYVRLSVSDTGCGVDPSTQECVIEADAGPSLGLSAVHGIIAQHNGWIDVWSEPGQGTRFSIYLPRVADAVAAATPTRVAEAWLRGVGTILVVDDRAGVRELVRETLEQCGYQILEAVDGEDGLEVFDLCGKEIALVITDLIMPRLGGAEFGRLVKQQRPETKVLYMSGYSGESSALDTGSALLQKPFTPEALARKVGEMLSSDAASGIGSLLSAVLETEPPPQGSATTTVDALSVSSPLARTP